MTETQQPQAVGDVLQAQNDRLDVLARLKDYFFNNLLSVFWTASLLLGAGIFLSYYWQIHYMPILDVRSLVGLIAAAGVTGAILTVILMGILVGPGTLWANVWASDSKLSHHWQSKDGLCDGKKMLLWFVLPVTMTLLTMVTLAFNRCLSITLAVASLAIIVGLPVWASRDSHLTVWQKLGETVNFFIATFGTAVMSGLAAWMIYRLSQSTSPSPTAQYHWAAIPLAVGFVIFANSLVVAVRKTRNTVRLWLSVGFATLFVTFTVFGLQLRIPDSVMALYKFGHIKAADVAFDGQACSALKALGVSSPEHTGVCVLDNLTIESRLGKDAYFAYSQGNHRLRFAIPSKDIISWKIDASKPTQPKQGKSKPIGLEGPARPDQSPLLTN